MRHRTGSRPTAVATINGAVGVHEERRPSKVIVELKLREVHIFHLDNADIDKFFLEFMNLGILTDNLPVEGSTGLSRHSAKEDKQRFAGLPCALSPLLKFTIHPQIADLQIFERLL